MRLRRWLATLLIVAGFASLAFAQDTNPMPDVRSAAAEAILALGTILTMFFVWGVKAALALAQKKLPKQVVLIAVPVIGIGVNYALAYVSGLAVADPVMAALTSVGATWLRELSQKLSTSDTF